jgi:hypothetical protein
MVFALAASTAGLAGQFARPSAAAVSNNIVVVSNTSDLVNGDVSSVSALNEHPGPDGISLREALTAANATTGTQTIDVMFSHAMNGRTIELRSPLPPIRRNHLVLEGIAPNDSTATVTIDGRYVRGVGNTYMPRDGGEYALLVVEASEVTVRGLRLTGVNPGPGNPPGWATAMAVGPGYEITPGGSPGPSTVANVQVEDDAFDESGFTFPFVGSSANGLIVGSSGLLTGTRTHLGNVTIAGNSFVHYTGDADALGVAGTPGETNSAFTIEDNTFDQDMIAIEPGGGERIIGNTITSTIPRSSGISLDTGLPHTVINDTLIEDNTIALADGSAIGIGAGSRHVGGDVISNTQIVNDVISAGQSSHGDAGIYIDGGDFTTSSPSRVAGVTIENDTLVTEGTGNLLNLIPNGTGASGNKITGVIIRNTILWDPNGYPISTGNQPVVNQAPDVVMNSLISGPSWSGSNGNVNANPQFVNEAAADYRLAAGSPAIGAGTTVGAPSQNIDGAPRSSPPNIGAY